METHRDEMTQYYCLLLITLVRKKGADEACIVIKMINVLCKYYENHKKIPQTHKLLTQCPQK